MADILGSVFGGAKSQTQKTTPDAQARELNKLKLSELSGLFGNMNFADLANEFPELYSLSGTSEDIFGGITDDSNILSLQDYMDLGMSASNNYISQIAKPNIMSSMALMGMESSGAVPEAIAKASAEYALPFISSLPQAANTITQNRSNIFSMSDIPRQLGAENLMRKTGVLTTGLTGIPFSPGSTQKGKESQQPLFGLFGQG